MILYVFFLTHCSVHDLQMDFTFSVMGSVLSCNSSAALAHNWLVDSVGMLAIVFLMAISL